MVEQSFQVLASSNVPITVGISPLSQIIAFAICMSFGILAGIFALLFFRQAQPIERALTDFFACVAITIIALLAFEYGTDGKIQIFGLLGFFLGIIIIPIIVKKIKRHYRK